MRLRPENRSSIVTVGLTPLIDVVFILLLFFMLATHFDRWRAVELQSAAGSKKPAASEARLLMVRIEPDRIRIGDETLAVADVGPALTRRLAARPGLDVVLEASDRVTLQRVIDVIDTVRAHGVTRLRLSLGAQ